MSPLDVSYHVDLIMELGVKAGRQRGFCYERFCGIWDCCRCSTVIQCGNWRVISVSRFESCGGVRVRRVESDLNRVDQLERLEREHLIVRLRSFQPVMDWVCSN